MERHHTHTVLVLSMLLAVLALPGTLAGSCLFADTCVNASHTATANGTVLGSGGYNGLPGTCATIGGTYDIQDDLAAIAACDFTSTGGGGTSCGTGDITTGKLGCLCGATTTTASNDGQYCCADGSIAASQGACATQPPTCAPDATLTSACSCGGLIIGPGSANPWSVACCGGTRNETSVNACSTSLPTARCGDLVRDPGEACDAQYAYRTTNPIGWYNVTGPGCTTNAYVCTATCECLQVGAQAPACDNGWCEPNELALCGGDAAREQLDCPAPPSCTPQGLPAPQIQSVTYDATSTSATVTWLPPDTANLAPGCSGAFVGYTLQRSSTSEQDAIDRPNVTWSNPPTAADTQFVDVTITAATASSTVAYYAVIAHYNTPGGVAQTVDTAQLNIPNPLCPVPNAKYCASASEAVNCNGYLPSTQTCNGNEVCSVGQDPAGGGIVAKCIPYSTQCDQCNGLFETFVDDGKVIQEPRGAGVFANVACRNALTCYKDIGTTSVPLYQSCQVIDSCVGYKTQDACVTDTCQRGPAGTGANGCVWQPLDAVTTRGVCLPAIGQLASCSACNSLGGSCNSQVCAAINESCYYYVQGSQAYTFTDLPTGCYEKTELPCEALTSEATCEGGTTYQLDVIYANGVRTGNTNAVTQVSTDALGHGKCTWRPDVSLPQGGLCARDIDQNAVPDIEEMTAATPLEQLRNLLDFTPPTTNILSIPSVLKPAAFAVPVSKEGSIWACFARQGTACYPNSTSFYTAGRIEKAFTEPESGAWALHYYSQDATRNLEVVRSFPFSVDTNPPTVTLVSMDKTLVQASGSLRTAVSIRLTADEPVWCNLTLRDVAGALVPQAVRVTPNLVDEYGENFSVLYPSLPDGTYSLEVSCVDSGGNPNDQPRTFAFGTDTDFTITNPSPVSTNPVATSGIDLRIETNESASCRFGPVGSGWSSMQDYDTTGGIVHAATRTFMTGQYELQTACDIRGVIVYGGPGDTIVFAVDLAPPSASVCDSNDPSATSASCTPLDTSVQGEVFSVTIRCQDSPTASPAFGCIDSDSEICVGSQSGPPCVLRPGYILNDINGTTNQLVRYRVTDRGGNSQDGSVVLQTADLTPPGQPRFDLFPIVP